jgi:hypothetical protein
VAAVGGGGSAGGGGGADSGGGSAGGGSVDLAAVPVTDPDAGRRRGFRGRLER